MKSKIRSFRQKFTKRTFIWLAVAAILVSQVSMLFTGAIAHAEMKTVRTKMESLRTLALANSDEIENIIKVAVEKKVAATIPQPTVLPTQAVSNLKLGESITFSASAPAQEIDRVEWRSQSPGGHLGSWTEISIYGGIKKITCDTAGTYFINFRSVKRNYSEKKDEYSAEVKRQVICGETTTTKATTTTTKKATTTTRGNATTTTTRGATTTTKSNTTTTKAGNNTGGGNVSGTLSFAGIASSISNINLSSMEGFATSIYGWLYDFVQGVDEGKWGDMAGDIIDKAASFIAGLFGADLSSGSIKQIISGAVSWIIKAVKWLMPSTQTFAVLMNKVIVPIFNAIVGGVQSLFGGAGVQLISGFTLLFSGQFMEALAQLGGGAMAVFNGMGGTSALLGIAQSFLFEFLIQNYLSDLMSNFNSLLSAHGGSSGRLASVNSATGAVALVTQQEIEDFVKAEIIQPIAELMASRLVTALPDGNELDMILTMTGNKVASATANDVSIYMAREASNVANGLDTNSIIAGRTDGMAEYIVNNRNGRVESALNDVASNAKAIVADEFRSRLLGDASGLVATINDSIGSFSGEVASESARVTNMTVDAGEIDELIEVMPTVSYDPDSSRRRIAYLY